MLHQPLLMLVWSFGDEINTNTVIAFIKEHILYSQAKPYGGLPPVIAEKWLKDYFIEHKEIVQNTLEKVIDANKRDLENRL